MNHLASKILVNDLARSMWGKVLRSITIKFTPESVTNELNAVWLDKQVHYSFLFCLYQTDIVCGHDLSNKKCIKVSGYVRLRYIRWAVLAVCFTVHVWDILAVTHLVIIWTLQLVTWHYLKVSNWTHFVFLEIASK